MQGKNRIVASSIAENISVIKWLCLKPGHLVDAPEGGFDNFLTLESKRAKWAEIGMKSQFVVILYALRRGHRRSEQYTLRFR
jgi:hypothetical protein